jgi:hypothetical protein
VVARKTAYPYDAWYNVRVKLRVFASVTMDAVVSTGLIIGAVNAHAKIASARANPLH